MIMFVRFRNLPVAVVAAAVEEEEAGAGGRFKIMKLGINPWRQFVNDRREVNFFKAVILFQIIFCEF